MEETGLGAKKRGGGLCLEKMKFRVFCGFRVVACALTARIVFPLMAP
jgi:hypothetical protein